MIWDGGLVCMMPVEGMLVGRTCTIGNTVRPPWTWPAYVLVTNEGHTISQLSGHDANQHHITDDTRKVVLHSLQLPSSPLLIPLSSLPLPSFPLLLYVWGALWTPLIRSGAKHQPLNDLVHIWVKKNGSGDNTVMDLNHNIFSFLE